MKIRDGFVEAVGNTPLIKLHRLSEQTGCTILGKAEFLNPGGSVKDRAAKWMVLDAERRGAIEAGGTIVEGTAGNTGIGLALMANARGYKAVITMPDTQSQEKKNFLRLIGAEVIEVPACPFSDDNHYTKIAVRLADELAKEGSVFYANQWDNLANRQSHIDSTSVEIWNQTEGTVDAFICAIGTGGTLSGTGAGLKAKNKDIVIGLADPGGSKMYSYFKDGVLESSGGSISEGIGQGRITGNLEDCVVDVPLRVSDEEALPILYDVLEYEGLCLGGSTAINLAGARALAKELGPGKTIVTMLCDGGARYQSKLWNPDFLRKKNLPVPAWLQREARSVDHLFL